jgi:hypothetical protein
VNGSGNVIASANIEHREAPAAPPVPLASEAVTGIAAE